MGGVAEAVAGGMIFFQEAAHFLDEILFREGLDKEIIGTQFEVVVFVIQQGDEQDGYILGGRIIANAGQNIEAGLDRIHDVKRNKIDVGLFGGGNDFRAIGCFENFIAFFLKLPAELLQYCR